MAWDRSNGMYYRSRRVGKKVTREYFGNGDAARLAAAIDDCKRRTQQNCTATVRASRQRFDAGCTHIDHLHDGLLVLLRAARLAASAYEHIGDSMANSKSDNVIEELRELAASCKSGDISVVPRIQHLLDQHAEITDHFGDAANVATEMWLFFYAGDNAIVAEATRRKMVTLRATISGPAPTPLEKLMVDLVMVCWLRVHALEALQAQAFQGKASKAIVREHERQVKASHLLYSQSLKQLAELRKLLPGGAGDQTDLGFPVVHTDSPESNGI